MSVTFILDSPTPYVITQSYIELYPSHQHGESDYAVWHHAIGDTYGAYCGQKSPIKTSLSCVQFYRQRVALILSSTEFRQCHMILSSIEFHLQCYVFTLHRFCHQLHFHRQRHVCMY